MTVLKISWPPPSNINQMDFNFYSLQLRIDGQLYNLTTNENSYIHEIALANDVDINVQVDINITAINKCNEMSEPLNRSFPLQDIGKPNQ